jgi:hypothetical protein
MAVVPSRAVYPGRKRKYMKRYKVKGFYKNIELNFGIVACFTDDLQELAESLKDRFDVTSITLEELPSQKKMVLDALPF